MSVNAEGERAIEVLSGKELNGRALTVNEPRPKADPGRGLSSDRLKTGA